MLGLCVSELSGHLRERQVADGIHYASMAAHFTVCMNDILAAFVQVDSPRQLVIV